MQISEALEQALEQRYGQSFSGDWHPLTGGYESDVYRVDDLVVRISPVWRSDDELRWVHEVTQHCAATIPEVIAPVSASDGTTLFRHENRPVSVFPYAPGAMLDLQDDHLVQQAARLLANIHKTALQWQAIRPRPGSQAAPTIPETQQDPKSIFDPELDSICERYFREHNPVQGIVHGDYYRANILCVEGQIRAVIDWDEAALRPLITEIAWAMWEFTHNAAGDDLDFSRAADFLSAYQSGRDALTETDIDHIIPLIRRHLRYEIRRSIADENRGEAVDMEYRNAEIRAFGNLRDKVLSL